MTYILLHLFQRRIHVTTDLIYKGIMTPFIIMYLSPFFLVTTDLIYKGIMTPQRSVTGVSTYNTTDLI